MFPCGTSTRNVFTGSMTLQNPSSFGPTVAYCVAGNLNSTGKLYLVIESVKLDTKHERLSTTPVVADGAGGNGMR